MGSPFASIIGEQCCPRSNIMTPATKMSQPCICETICRTNASCLFYSHAPFPVGHCEFCSILANCTKEELRGRRTWARFSEGTPVDIGPPLDEVVQAREAAPKCPRHRFIVQNTVNSKVTKKDLEADPHLPMSKLLGSAAGTLPEDLTSGAGCKGNGEEKTFRAVCAPMIQEMDSHLAATKGKRGLFFVFEGRSQWGWGNLLPAVYA